MSPGLAAAAQAHADAAQAAAQGISVRELIVTRTKARIAERSKQASREGVSLPGRTWAAIDVRTRTVLVMLGASQEGDPRRLAAQPWASFPAADQCSMAAVARQLRRQLDSAASLF